MLPRNGKFLAKQHKAQQIIGFVALLVFFLDACSTSSSSSPDLTSWREVRSPLFASEWPPTSETTWVRYTFAYGSNPEELMDGEYVTNPLTITECNAGEVITTELSTEMTKDSVQGVIPLDDATSLLLQNEKPGTSDCVDMTELPDTNLPETQELIAYYQAWFKYNGVFLDLIRRDHKGFIDWVLTN